jgi:hypothetical protein
MRSRPTSAAGSTAATPRAPSAACSGCSDASISAAPPPTYRILADLYRAAGAEAQAAHWLREETDKLMQRLG